ncbi:MAG: methionyl-tRNA formyltransferase [Bacteroidetes bacterium]|nr:methionyl-tRNA formyltransferase [Bacteroidota bacterium]
MSLKLVFMGTPDFAVPILEKLILNGYKPVAIVTGKDKPQGRGLQLQETPVKQCAKKHGIETILEPEDLKGDEFYHQMKAIDADCYVVVAFRILPERIFSLPAKGTFNLHGSLLPKYRGAAPMQWALLNGDKETGVTTFFLQKAVDTGTIIGRKKLLVSDSMTGSELHDQLSNLGADLVLETVIKIDHGTVKTEIQDDTLATRAPKLTKEDFRIDWNLPGAVIRNKIRAFDDYPGAFCYLDGKVLKLFKVDFFQETQYPYISNGLITGLSKSNISIKVSDGMILIGEVQLEGKRRLSVQEFLNGYHLKTGIQLN